VPVSTVDEVIAEALVSLPIAIEWIEPAEVEAVAKKPDGESGVVTH
jgi:ATP-dependent Lon protease